MWPKKDYPLKEVSIFELNKNPDNYFQDVEQAAFNPANLVPGISFSPDKVLQARLFMYSDAQRYRLGVNHHQIPVNSPRGMKKEDYHTFHRDGQMKLMEIWVVKTTMHQTLMETGQQVLEMMSHHLR